MNSYYLREVWRSMRQHRGLTFTATVSVAAALLVAGVFLLLAHNAQTAIGRVGDRRELVVYLRDDVRGDARDTLERRLGELYGAPTFVSKEEAWRKLSGDLGDPALLEAVGENPLPASFHIKLRPELLNYEAMERTAQQVAQFPEVEDVRYGGEWVRRLDDFAVSVRRLALSVGLVVAGCLLLIFYNTLRLSMIARRDQVVIMSDLGASAGFITMPFVIEAMFEAGAGAVVALLILFGARQALSTVFTGVDFLPIPWSLGFVGAAVTLGCLAAWVASSRALGRLDP